MAGQGVEASIRRRLQGPPYQRWDSRASPSLLPSSSLVRRQQLHWPAKFIHGQPLVRKVHNQSYIDFLHEIWRNHGGGGDPAEAETECPEAEADICEKEEKDQQDEPEEQSDADDQSATSDDDDAEQDEGGGDGDGSDELEPIDSCLARIFMRGRLHLRGTEVIDKYHGQARRVEEFCGNLGISDLVDAATPVKRTPNILLHETSVDGKRRKSNGHLQSYQLYSALRIERFIEGNTATAATAAHSTTADDKHKSAPAILPDADQRYIYIHNLGPCDAAVLMASASLHEVQSRRNLLGLHLSRREEIAVDIPVSGFMTFAMTVSIPFHTLVEGPLCSAQPLRDPLWIFSGHAAAEKQYLYKAHTTVQVAGFDNTRWTAIDLVDSPHQIDSVQHPSKLEPGISDPLIRHEFEFFDLFKSDPRLYFLNVWEAQIAHIATKLEGVVYCLNQAAEHIWEQDPMLIPSSPLHPLPGVSSPLQNSINKAMSLLYPCKVVRDDLSRIINAWEQFQMCDIDYFHDDADDSLLSNEMSAALIKIGRIYLRLKKTTLHFLEKIYRDLCRYQELNSRNQSIALATEHVGFTQQIQFFTESNHKLAIEQQRSGEIMRKFTHASMIFLPLMLASGLFSMNSAVFPSGFDQTPASFICTLVVLVLLTILLVNFLDFLLSILPSIGLLFADLLRFPFFYFKRQTDSEGPELPA